MEEYLSKALRYARIVLFLVTGITLTYYLLARTGSAGSTVTDIVCAIKGSSIPWLGAAFLLFSLTELIRAWRWQLLSNRHRITLAKAIPITAVHVGLGHLLPVRLSDVATVGLFRRYSALPAGSGAATVLLAKIMDVVAMGSVVSFSFLTGLSGPVVYIAAGAAAAGIVSMVFLPGLLRAFTGPVNALTGGGRFAGSWQEMVKSIEITPERRKSVFIAMAASIAGWFIKLFMFQALLRAVGVHGIPLWQVFTASAVTDLTMALPVHGLLSLGTVEAGWVAGFAIVGITGNLPGGLSVVEAGFSVHLLWLSMAVLLMLAGTPFLLRSSGKETG